MDDGHAATLFRGVFEAVHDAVVIVDHDGRVMLANESCHRVFGHSPAALRGEPVGSLVPERHRAAFATLLDERRQGVRRITALRADGAEFPAEVSLAEIPVDGTSYLVASVRDITSWILREERVRGLIEAAPDATLIADSDGRIVLMNARVGAVLGFDGVDLVGKPLHSIVAHPPREEIDARIANYVQDPQPMPMGYTQEFRGRHRDGHEFPIEISIAPVRAGDDTFLSIAVRDVTERNRMQAEADRLRDELIATVSHELRTPLTSIIGYAEMMADLRDDDLSPRARELLAVIERNAGRELRLVDDLLTMAFLDDNRLRIVRTAIDLVDVCRRVVEDHAPTARERGLELTLVDRQLQPVLGDFYRLVQVVENLVTNAVKFTPAGGRIEVRILDRGSSGVVEVRDTGVGVSPEERAKLFERLYRAPSAIASQTQGAGLGLSIVRAIVEAHDGWVQLESQLGAGTTIRFGIPFAVP